MTLTTGERALFALYVSSSRRRTAALVREALLYIDEPDIKQDAAGIIEKLGSMSDEEFRCLATESEDSYA